MFIKLPVKSLILLLPAFFSVTELRSQNCKTLDNTKFFQSIKFGAQIPSGIFTDCAKGMVLNNEYFLDYDSLPVSCRKKYSDLFKFYSSTFSKLNIRINNSGEIYFTNLWSVLDSADFTGGRLPRKFTGIYARLRSLFGKETRREDENDSVLVQAYGMNRVVIWECNNIKLELKVNYGSSIKELNVLSFNIMNRIYDKVEQVETL